MILLFGISYGTCCKIIYLWITVYTVCIVMLQIIYLLVMICGAKWFIHELWYVLQNYLFMSYNTCTVQNYLFMSYVYTGSHAAKLFIYELWYVLQNYLFMSYVNIHATKLFIFECYNSCTVQYYLFMSYVYLPVVMQPNYLFMNYDTCCKILDEL